MSKLNNKQGKYNNRKRRHVRWWEIKKKYNNGNNIQLKIANTEGEGRMTRRSNKGKYLILTENANT